MRSGGTALFGKQRCFCDGMRCGTSLQSPWRLVRTLHTVHFIVKLDQIFSYLKYKVFDDDRE